MVERGRAPGPDRLAFQPRPALTSFMVLSDNSYTLCASVPSAVKLE